MWSLGPDERERPDSILTADGNNDVIIMKEISSLKSPYFVETNKVGRKLCKHEEVCWRF